MWPLYDAKWALNSCSRMLLLITIPPGLEQFKSYYATEHSAVIAQEITGLFNGKIKNGGSNPILLSQKTEGQSILVTDGPASNDTASLLSISPPYM